MKYLRTYEQLDNEKLKEGDYLLHVGNQGSVGNWVKLLQYMGAGEWKVEMRSKTYNKYKFHTMWLHKYSFDRYLTPGEINQYEMEKETDKFNL